MLQKATFYKFLPKAIRENMASLRDICSFYFFEMSPIGQI